MIIGTGIDIIEIARVRSAIARWGDRFLERIFNPQEVAYALSHTIPFQHFAGRFAAKEAIYKALGIRSLSWKDITIGNDATGKPSCLIKGLSPDTMIFISISHSKYYAIANAVVEKQ